MFAMEVAAIIVLLGAQVISKYERQRRGKVGAGGTASYRPPSLVMFAVGTGEYQTRWEMSDAGIGNGLLYGQGLNRSRGRGGTRP
jgi:hypothetical protein